MSLLFRPPPFITAQRLTPIGQQNFLPTAPTYTLIVDDMRSAHRIDAAGDLTQANILGGLGDLALAHRIDAAGNLVQANILGGLGDLALAHRIDAAGDLIQGYTLSLADLDFDHRIDAAGALTQANTLVIFDVFHYHRFDGAVDTYSDDFNRADEDIEDSSDWIPAVGWDDPPEISGNIVSNTLRTDISGPPGGELNAQWAHDPASADCYMKLTIVQHIVGDGQTIYLGLRGDGFAVFSGAYLQIINPQYWVVHGYKNNQYSGRMFYEDQTIQDGDEVEFRLVGNTFIVLVNGIELIADPDNPFNDADAKFQIVNDRYVLPEPYCPTAPGFVDLHGHCSSTDDGWIFDDFETGSLGTALDLTQNFIIAPADLALAHRIDATELVVSYTLELADLDFDHRIDAAGTLVQANILGGLGDLALAHRIDALELIQQNILAGLGDLAFAHRIDAAGNLTQAHVLAIDDMDHDHRIDAVVLTQQNILAMQDAMLAHRIDSVELTFGALLEPHDQAFAFRIENVELTQQNVLALADMMLAHRIDAVVLTQQHILAVADLAQAHRIDAITLLPAITLTVADTRHLFRLDGDLEPSTLEFVWQVLSVAPRGEFTFAPSVDGSAASTFTAPFGPNDFAAKQ